MTALELGSDASAGVTPARGLVVRLSRLVLFAEIFVIYIGAQPFLIMFSPDLLYGTYVVIGACAVGILCFERVASRSVLSTVPYLVWLLVFYCIWGTMMKLDGGPWAYRDHPGKFDDDEVIKMFVKNVVVLSAFALAVINRRDLARAANWFQIGALLNLAICFWEVWDPNVISSLALDRDPEVNAFNVLRPAGLWRNPDEAAFAFIFAFLISYWARRPLAWIGRLACLVGIYLTASRTGVYILALCAAIHFAFRLRSKGFLFRWLKGFSLCLAATAVAALVLTESSTLRTIQISKEWEITRIFDLTEKSAYEPTRFEIAKEGMERIWERPWTGHGIYSFDTSLENSAVAIGVHNVFILVWGETGIPGIVSFLMVLALGTSRSFHPQIASSEQSILLRMWISYLVIGLTWHNQFTEFSGMLYAALLYHLPSVTQRYPAAAPAVGKIIREAVTC
jgi:O-antigen ligase